MNWLHVRSLAHHNQPTSQEEEKPAGTLATRTAIVAIEMAAAWIIAGVAANLYMLLAH